jgi:hypothetical protein
MKNLFPIILWIPACAGMTKVGIESLRDPDTYLMIVTQTRLLIHKRNYRTNS